MADVAPAPASSTEALTLLLHQAQAGDAQAAERAYQALYPELLKIARARLRGHQVPTLLDTRALVHESFLRFVSGATVAVHNRKHFYAHAAKAMRHIVIDFVRRTQAQRRGGGQGAVTLDTLALHDLADQTASAVPVNEVEQALQALEQLDPQLAELVELRYFGGYTDAEVAEALGVSERTVRRLWNRARAFLLLQLQAG